MTYHPTVQTILLLLKNHSLWFETFEHEPVRTSYEAAHIREGHYTLNQGAKALIVRVKKSGTEPFFVMLVLSGDSRFDGKKVKKLLNVRDIRFATTEEVADVTKGIEPGGVPPFGNLFGLDVLVDPQLLKNEMIIFNAGDRSYSIAMKSDDYIALVQPRIEHLCR
ncbi:MAG: hypothetical protein NUV65_02620 [Candidatus Roizmanbacteria bacterium]|nr:hypothetical protein [Candidatus Roizmanbacteria bacterium]